MRLIDERELQDAIRDGEALGASSVTVKLEAANKRLSGENKRLRAQINADRAEPVLCPQCGHTWELWP